MAQIVINEISNNYTYNIGASSFATVALPITACWGPAFTEPSGTGSDQLDELTWQKFTANQEGLEAFVSTYRGPSSLYRRAQDMSYHMAMTLLAAGYDVLVCRLSPGKKAYTTLKLVDTTVESGSDAGDDNTSPITIQAKYPGTFGNNIYVNLSNSAYYNTLSKAYDKTIWNLIVYIIDATGVKTAVENIRFVADVDDATDSIMHISEIESKFVDLAVTGDLPEIAYKSGDTLKYNAKSTYEGQLSGGQDCVNETIEDSAGNISTDGAKLIQLALKSAKTRYNYNDKDNTTMCDYLTLLASLETPADGSKIDGSFAQSVYYREWLYTNAIEVYDMLKDKLSYSPNRIISPGWDDQDFGFLNGTGKAGVMLVPDLDDNGDQKTDQDGKGLTKPVPVTFVISPLHKCLMELGYASRCGTSLLDVPKSMPRDIVYFESTDIDEIGYAQKLARHLPAGEVNTGLFASHSALFAPWGQYTYVGTNKQSPAPPAFLNLLIHRAMILNQTLQYEWALPTNRKHNLNLGKFDYTVTTKLLNEWQKLDGVGVNVITSVPDLGNTIWGNSTLFEVPPATYQALANLSTRYLVNAVENVVYKCGISITFQYNNEQAYNKFYAGVTPILDTMKNVGAIDDYFVKMAADINGLDQVNANTVIGKIYLVVNGVVNDIYVDLVALPPGTDLNQFKG